MDEKQNSRCGGYQPSLDEIPGGVQLCLNEGPAYPIVEINRGFVDLLGFTREEVADQFGNSYSAMLHPSDRPEVIKKIKEHLAKDEKIALSYRMLCKDGSYKWVKDNAHLIRGEDGSERIFGVILDDTESWKAREELRLSLERHQIILDQTTDIIFEWDIPSDTLICSSNWFHQFGYEPIKGGLTKAIPLQSHVHPDDIPTLMTAMNEARSGGAYFTVELRIRNAQGKHRWFRIRAANQYDGSGRPLKAVGIITDIDEEKKMIENLRHRAERDALTGLYNREETERQIREYLRGNPEKLCALFVIDTDNFKRVNDSLGHLFGDSVLEELASGMKKLTRQTDVVGRIGGDEFAIFLKDLPCRENAAKKAAELLDLFQHLFREEKQPMEITCSAGVAIYPDDGKDFQTLYHSADIALYQAKSLGKNRYQLFDGENSPPVNQAASALGASIDSDQGAAGISDNLVTYVFQILFDAGDIDRAIGLILEIVGKRFDVSRAYIFENSEDGKYCDNTYEWCNEGISPQKENLRHYPYEAVEGYQDLFKDNAIFYCRDVRSLTPAQAAVFESQGIRSTLQCAILEEGVFKGFVGFDECTGTRMWTKEEIGMLSLISQMLTTFLQKKRATERDREIAVQLNTILDTQAAYIYAIEQSSYELLYLNNRTKQLDPRAKIGMTCYQAFFSRSAPCEWCPLSGGDGEIYNPQYQLWAKVHVAPMKWGTVDSYLLSCFDITEYKRMQNGK